MTENILAIDQGTTNTKALLVSPQGTIVGRGSVPTGVRYPRPGWVEQDPREIWRCTCKAIAICLTGVEDPRLAAIGIANQRETALVWERASGEPVGSAVVWQCRRTAEFCQKLKAQGHEALVQARTGLQVDPMFSGTKIRWLLNAIPDGPQRAANGELCAGNVDAWLLWRLTGGSAAAGAVHATDTTNASRTQLMALETLAWDPEILEIFGLSAAILPTIQPSAGCFGHTATLDLGAGCVLPAGIPIASMIGDSHASLYGLGGFRSGSVKATYGTGTSLMTPSPDPVCSTRGLSTTIAWSAETTVYALEGNIYTTGGAVQWLGNLLSLDDPGPEIEALARTVPDAGGVTFVPALVGLGAPHWRADVQGLLTGLTLGVGAGHLARATLDAIAYQVRDVFDVMQQESGAALQTLLADGGASRNDLLMQLQADILGCSVERSRSTEVSPLGAAFLAGQAVGLWADESEIASLIPPRDRFEPQVDEPAREAAYARWRAAIDRTLYRR